MKIITITKIVEMRILLILCFCGVTSINTIVKAQDIQKERDWYAPQNVIALDKAKYKKITRTFRKSYSIGIVFHYEQSKWCGISLDNFTESVLAKKLKLSMDSVNMQDLLPSFEKSFIKGMSSENKRNTPHSLIKSDDIVLHILVKRVTKNAGISARGLFVYKESIPFLCVNLNVEDDKWNNFSSLLFENAEEMGHNLYKMLRGSRYKVVYFQSSLLIRKK